MFIALVLALSLALSPVSVYADELDTPVHEDPIDEIQYDSDWVSGHISRSKNGKTVEFDVSAYCEFSWTEGIGSQFQSATIFLSNIKVNGWAAGYDSATPIYIDTYNTWGRATQTFTYSTILPIYTATFTVRVLCDEYGVLSINADLLG